MKGEFREFINRPSYVATLWKCAYCIKSLSIYIVAFFIYDLMKKKNICLPTYPNFSDRVGSGETKIFLNVASVDSVPDS